MPSHGVAFFGCKLQVTPGLCPASHNPSTGLIAVEVSNVGGVVPEVVSLREWLRECEANSSGLEDLVTRLARGVAKSLGREIEYDAEFWLVDGTYVRLRGGV
jgi:hypothetical protein